MIPDRGTLDELIRRTGVTLRCENRSAARSASGFSGGIGAHCGREHLRKRMVFDADGVANAKELIATARVPIVTGKGWFLAHRQRGHHRFQWCSLDEAPAI